MRHPSERRLRVLTGALLIGTPVFLNSGLESIWASIVATALIVGIVVLYGFTFWSRRDEFPGVLQVLLSASVGMIILRVAQQAI